MEVSVLNSSGSGRRGSLLVVIMGLILILLGMTVAVSVRVKASMDNSEEIQKHAQAFLMMRACKMYMDVRWARVNMDPTYASAPMKMLGVFAPPSGTRSALTGGDGGDGGSTAMTQSATSAPTTGLGPLANRLGWFHIAKKSDTEAYIIASGGGGGVGTSGGQAKRNGESMYPSANPRDAYDVLYYYLLTNPGSAGSATQSWIQVLPLGGMSSTSPVVNSDQIWLVQ